MAWVHAVHGQAQQPEQHSLKGLSGGEETVKWAGGLRGGRGRRMRCAVGRAGDGESRGRGACARSVG